MNNDLNDLQSALAPNVPHRARTRRGRHDARLRGRRDGIEAAGGPIKVVPIDGGPQAVERCHREISSAAQLQHPHIVPVLTAGEANGVPWFAMPYVAGESLRARLAGQGALPIAEATKILRDVAQALAYARAQGFVHRDIKPDNVLLADGPAVVTAFGVAKALSSATNAPHGTALTGVGMAVGTPPTWRRNR